MADDEAADLLHRRGERRHLALRSRAGRPARRASRSITPERAAHLTADVEGLSIYYASGGAGYLLASSQGDSTYSVYERQPPHAFRLNFRIADNPALGIDGVPRTPTGST